jgi:hypothetical protein
LCFHVISIFQNCFFIIKGTETTIRELLRNSISLDPRSSLSLDIAPEHASSLSEMFGGAAAADVPMQWALSYDASMIVCDDDDNELDLNLEPRDPTPEPEVIEAVLAPVGTSEDLNKTMFE